MASGMESSQEGPSVAWYILPILFSFIGGLIMYFAVRGRDPKMAKMGLVVGVLMFIVPTMLGAAVIFFGGALFASERAAANGSTKISNANLWVSPDGRSSAGAMVVTNTGSDPLTINSITVRGIFQAYGTWFYNNADATPSNINMPLIPDYTPSSVNVDLDPAEEPFITAMQPVVLAGNQSAILYLSNPGMISGIDKGNTYAVMLQADDRAQVVQVLVTSG